MKNKMRASYDGEKEYKRKRFSEATEKAKKILKASDRIGLTKCPGTKRTITFSHFDGNWIVSKSGINDYSACNIYNVNGRHADFNSENGKQL